MPENPGKIYRKSCRKKLTVYFRTLGEWGKLC